MNDWREFSGNHGQALAWAAARKGLKCVVVAPENTSPAKLSAIRSYGAELVLCAPTMSARIETCQKLGASLNYPIVHPHDDWALMSGQGTIALELLEQVSVDLDAVLVSVGGGGLASGIAQFISSTRPSTKVFLCEAEGKNLGRQLERGEPERHSDQLLPTIADGIRVPCVGHLNFPVLLECCEKTVFNLNDDEIRSATRLIWQRLKVVVEPSAALPLAAVLKYGESCEALKQCKNIALVLCGGNIDTEKLFPD